ncbi:MAG: ergothioneine biosynthesis protein EgtB [Thermoleophilaceae bacterium]
MCPDETQTLPRGGVAALAADRRGPAGLSSAERYRDALAEARERTLSLVAPVTEEDMDRVHDPLMSPLVWDLGHIAAFEDLWLCRRAGGLAPLRPDLAEVYDAAETPRSGRGDIPYLRRDDALEFMQEVRERALGVLERVDMSAAGDRLNADGFVWEMLVEHEHQHNETMLQTLQLAEPGVFSPERRPIEVGPLPGPETVTIEAGPCTLGDPGEGFAYDNERPRHGRELPAFEIDRAPVTNGRYLRFVEEGGYARRELWSAAGWTWRERERIERPLYWSADGRERRFDQLAAIDPHMPVMHVSCHEAEAFARWSGRRLPTEAEWEKAAAWDADDRCARRYPWGEEPPTTARANLDQLAFGPVHVGALDGATPGGVVSLIGDCWEWTASELAGYPGFAPFPYREYSEVFFGEGLRVLRGAAWATRPSIARNTFRNWDLPERRQIFVGFRCAADA